MRIPVLETARLLIRPFSHHDLEAVHQILDVELGEVDFGSEGALSRAERERWLRWTVLSYGELERLHQPPYGDRAIVLRRSGALIGAVGLVPCLNRFGLLPGLSGDRTATAATAASSSEIGLFYAIGRAHQRQGYASEAARALADAAFAATGLGRLVATTTHDNAASIAVMERLGMRIERNPSPDPPWLQVVGILNAPGRAACSHD